MADDQLLGVLSEDQARINLMTYIKNSFAAAPSEISALEIIYPNMKPPALESRTDPFLLLTVNTVHTEQTGMGETSYSTIKMLDISLWIREYTGIKLTSKFIDFAKGLGLKTVANISYGTVAPSGSKKYKGWEFYPIFLPLNF
jgi:hypothetical protein